MVDSSTSAPSATWTEETRALKRIMETSQGISTKQLAQDAGLSIRQMQDRVAMLQLPWRLRQLIDSGVLPWTAARQSLVFVGKDHKHDKELEFLARRLVRLTKAYWFPGYLTHVNVAMKIYDVIFHSRLAANWQQFDDEIKLGDHLKEAPLFDAAAFRKHHSRSLHTVSKLWRNGKRRAFTCAGEAWLTAQTKAKEEFSVENAIAAIATSDVLSGELLALPECSEGSNENIDAPQAVRPLLKCTAGLPNDFEDHWHIQWPDEWGSAHWINESPAFLESELAQLQSFIEEHNLTGWWLTWHEYTRPKELQ